MSRPGCRSFVDSLLAKFNGSLAEGDFQAIAHGPGLYLALSVSDSRIVELAQSKTAGFVEAHGGAIIVRFWHEVY